MQPGPFVLRPARRQTCFQVPLAEGVNDLYTARYPGERLFAAANIAKVPVTLKTFKEFFMPLPLFFDAWNAILPLVVTTKDRMRYGFRNR